MQVSACKYESSLSYHMERSAVAETQKRTPCCFLELRQLRGRASEGIPVPGPPKYPKQWPLSPCFWICRPSCWVRRFRCVKKAWTGSIWTARVGRTSEAMMSDTQTDHSLVYNCPKVCILYTGSTMIILERV